MNLPSAKTYVDFSVNFFFHADSHTDHINFFWRAHVPFCWHILWGLWKERKKNQQQKMTCRLETWWNVLCLSRNLSAKSTQFSSCNLFCFVSITTLPYTRSLYLLGRIRDGNLTRWGVKGILSRGGCSKILKLFLLSFNLTILVNLIFWFHPPLDKCLLLLKSFSFRSFFMSMQVALESEVSHSWFVACTCEFISLHLLRRTRMLEGARRHCIHCVSFL